MTRINEFDFKIVRDALATAEAQFREIDAAYDLEFSLDYCGSDDESLSRYERGGPDIELIDAHGEGVIGVSLPEFIEESRRQQIQWDGEDPELSEEDDDSSDTMRARLCRWKNAQLLKRLNAAVQEWRAHDASISFEEAATRRTGGLTHEPVRQTSEDLRGKLEAVGQAEGHAPSPDAPERRD